MALGGGGDQLLAAVRDRARQLPAAFGDRGGQVGAGGGEGVALLVRAAVDAGEGVGEDLLQGLAGAVEVLVHALVDLVEAAAQGGFEGLDALAQRVGDGARDRVDLAVLLVQVTVEVVDALVDARELVLETVHAARDAFEAAGDAVEAAVQLGEGLGELVHQGVDRATDVGDCVVLGLQLGEGFVQPLREDADLGAVRQLRQALADRTQRLQRRHPGVDLVQRVEDLLLLALTDLRGAREHVAHPIEGHRGVVVLCHG